MPIQDERNDIARTIHTIHSLTGKPPCGWYTGRKSINTRQLITEFDCILYDSDSYADDQPYFINTGNKDHLIIPYTLDCNDFGFIRSEGFITGNQFYDYLMSAYRVLRSEGEAGRPKLLTIGLHPRIIAARGDLMGFSDSLNIFQRKIHYGSLPAPK